MRWDYLETLVLQRVAVRHVKRAEVYLAEVMRRGRFQDSVR